MTSMTSFANRQSRCSFESDLRRATLQFIHAVNSTSFFLYEHFRSDSPRINEMWSTGPL